jgi:hypothetical protein
MLCGCWALGHSRRGFLQPPALAVKLQQMAVVHQPVEQWRDDDRIAEESRPVFEWTIRRDDGRRFFIAAPSSSWTIQEKASRKSIS